MDQIERTKQKIEYMFWEYDICIKNIENQLNNPNHHFIELIKIVYGLDYKNDINYYKKAFQRKINLRIAEELLFINWTDNERTVVREVQRFLKINNIMSCYYSIGCRRENTFSILKKDNKFIVSYFSHNKEQKRRSFDNVYSACINLTERFSQFIDKDIRKNFKLMLHGLEKKQKEYEDMMHTMTFDIENFLEKVPENNVYMYSNSLEFKSKIKKKYNDSRL